MKIQKYRQHNKAFDVTGRRYLKIDHSLKLEDVGIVTCDPDGQSSVILQNKKLRKVNKSQKHFGR